MKNANKLELEIAGKPKNNIQLRISTANNKTKGFASRFYDYHRRLDSLLRKHFRDTANIENLDPDNLGKPVINIQTYYSEAAIYMARYAAEQSDTTLKLTWRFAEEDDWVIARGKQKRVPADNAILEVHDNAANAGMKEALKPHLLNRVHQLASFIKQDWQNALFPETESHIQISQVLNGYETEETFPHFRLELMAPFPRALYRSVSYWAQDYNMCVSIYVRPSPE